MNFLQKEPIQKGWSGDKKYRVTDESGRTCLLRISDKDQYDKKKRQFDLMGQVAALDIPMCRPIAFGLCQEGVYSLQSWIEGEDAEQLLPTLPEQAQYRCGLEAGRILKKIHSIPAPADLESWESRFNRKIDSKIRMYQACPVKCDNGQVFLDYLAANRHLLNGRPQCYQHGDYHIGNMMIGRDKRLYIIDFDRDDFGDPWEEFNRIVWCAQAAPAFASGMVDGYFDGAVPPDFWRLLALYISSNMLGSVPWALPFGEEQIRVMLDQAKDVLSWYDDMRDPVPAWYMRP